MDREPITVPEAAAILGVSARTVRRYVRDGKLSGRKVDREGTLAEWQLDADIVEAVRADKQRGQTRTDAPERYALRLEVQVAELSDQVRTLTAALTAMQAQFQEQTATLQRLLPPAPDPEGETRQADSQSAIAADLSAIREELQRDREARQVEALTVRSIHDQWRALPWWRRAFTRRPGPRRRH
jgi:excisionase family DNA binding protein